MYICTSYSSRVRACVHTYIHEKRKVGGIDFSYRLLSFVLSFLFMNLLVRLQLHLHLNILHMIWFRERGRGVFFFKATGGRRALFIVLFYFW